MPWMIRLYGTQANSEKRQKWMKEKMSTNMSIDLNVICNLLIKLFEANIICLTMNTFYEQLKQPFET